MSAKRQCVFVYSICGLLLQGTALTSEPSMVSPALNIHGMPGVIDMPSAEVAPDGALSFTFSSVNQSTVQGTLNFQITPRLSGSFRYSGLDGFHADGRTLYDRSFDLSYQVLDESQFLPAVSVGINDLLGTGIFSSEYVVATKSFMDDRLRLTGGLGWGRLATRGAIGTPFGDRPPLDFGLGGVPNFDQWFRGPVAPFGGVSFELNDKVTLLAEYSSDAYALEESRGIYVQESPFNFGVRYQLTPSTSVSAYYMYGNAIGFQVTAMADPNRAAASSGNEAAPLAVKPRPYRSAQPDAWGTEWASDPRVEPGLRNILSATLDKDGLVLEAMSFTASRAEIRITNNRYGSNAQAVGRAARIMSRVFPASVETFVVTLVSHGVPVSSVTLQRSDIEALENAPAAQMLERVTFSDPAATNSADLTPTPDLYPRFTWSLQPYLTVSLFDPNLPVAADFGLRLAAAYDIAPGWVVSGAITKKLVGNLDSSDRLSDSILPHVRSDGALYSREGDPAIEKLTLAWYGRPAPNLYSRVTVGYLEPMFAGVSAELLWKPVDSQLAFGAELNVVQQRDYNQLFGLQDYGTVSGHVSAYYDFQNGFTTQLDVGRYLAGDYGATLSIDRTFANGWKVGAYATLTNLSPEEFGEGTFDKGIRISIPLDWSLGTPTRASSNSELRSLSRDGGARLQVDGRLFDWVQDGQADVLADRWGKFWR